MRGTLKHIIKKLLIVAACIASPMSPSLSEAAVPDITYKSSTSSPYSSAQLEYTRAGTYTWTVPAGVDQIKVTTVGGGGRGDDSIIYGFGSFSYSGGGGAIVENVLISVSDSPQITIIVGGSDEASYIQIKEEKYAIAPAGDAARYGTGPEVDFILWKDRQPLGGQPGGGNGCCGGTAQGALQTNGKYGKAGTNFGKVYGTSYGGTAVGAGGSWGNGGSPNVSPTVGGGGSYLYGNNGNTSMPQPQLIGYQPGADGAVFINYGSSSTATTGISLNQSSLTLNINDTETLIATISPADAEDKTITWTTSDSAVATVVDGKVTAVGSGTAMITATASGGQEATCTVTVSQPLTGISLPSSSLSIAAGASAQITPVFTPSNATDKTVTWTSSNNSVASVDASGNVTALKPGVTTITAKAADGGFTASCIVKVTSKTRSVFLKINPEAEPMPYYATALYYGLTDGIVQSYPGLDVTEVGIIEAPIAEPSGDFNIGVKTQNTLISGILASEAESDFTSETLNLITGDLDSDNIITGSDFTLLTQAMNYPPAVTDGLSMTGDLNGDGEVNRLDRIIFNKSILWTGEDRFLHPGFDMKESPARMARTLSLFHANLPSRQESIIKLAQVSDNVYELSLTEDTPSINMLQISLTNEDNIMYIICPPPRTMGSLR